MDKVRVIASEKSWIEGDAVQQLQQTAQWPGMKMAVGMPDLHPGKGAPVGAAFLSEGVLYPYLVGNDIGCGMGLWRTDLKQRKLKRDRWVSRLHGLESPWEGDTRAWLNDAGVAETGFENALGTIGGGNHFAELQQVASVDDPEAFESLGLDKKRLVLLVHSGSRGLGHSILRDHIEQHAADGLVEGTPEADAYLTRHDQAVRWAAANRALIAHRFLEAIGAEHERVLDACHNLVTPLKRGEHKGWLHRKGAAPADVGPVVIPGSRGSVSVLFWPTPDHAAHAAWSLAHGAGRKWARGEVRKRLQHMRADQLTHTDLGSRVICEDKSLLFEEAPQAYKNIHRVIQDLVDAGLGRVVATLKPIITYKVRR